MSLIKQHLYNQMQDLEDDQQGGTDPLEKCPKIAYLKEVEGTAPATLSNSLLSSHHA